MNKILLSKITIIATAFGAGFSLILGLASGVGIGMVVLRMLVSAVVLGGLAIGAQVVFQKLLPADELKKIFSDGKDEEVASASNGEQVDMMDDSEMSAADLYAGALNEHGDHIVENPHRPSEDHELPMEMKGEGFSETNFGSDAPHISVDGGQGNIDMVSDQYSRMRNEGTTPTASVASKAGNAREDGKVKFESGGKTISADPITIAKAIKTVLKRE